MPRRFLVLTIASLIATFCANADIVPSLEPGFPTGPVGGNFLYVYQADLSSVERLDPVATNGNTCFGTNPCKPAGTFFTIYDVGGLNITATLAAPRPVGWGISVQTTGLTPFNAGVPDGNLPNVTFTYTGPVVNGPVFFGGFEIISTADGVVQGNYSSQATNNITGLTNGSTDFAFGQLSVPASTVPEPAAVSLLLSVGLIGLAFVRKRFARQ